MDAVRGPADELGANLQCEARLTCSPGTCDGQEPRSVREERDDFLELSIATEQLRGGDRQVRRIECAKRREIARPQLVQPLRLAQVLEPVDAEVLQRQLVG